MINLSALILGALIAAELIALVARRAWVHWKLGHRAPLVDDAITSLADALVIGVVIVRPQGRTARRAFRLAALELFPMLAGESRRELARIVDEIGLVDDVIRTLERSPRAYARRTATDELAEIASERAVPALEQALGDRDRIVRITAVRALAAVPRLDRIERMTEVLDQDSRLLAELASDNALLASVAVGALERLGGHEAADSLREVAADPARDPALREQAERALDRVSGQG
jgi:HEAT repeat protein